MTYIFIGFLFVFFDITFFIVNLMPDLIGFALIFMGVLKFDNKVNNFIKVKPWLIYMVIYSLLAYLCLLLGVNVNNILFDILRHISIVIIIYCAWLIIMGINELERMNNIDLCFDKLIKVWKYKVILAIASAICSYLIFSSIFVFLLMVIVFAAFVNEVYFLVLMYRVQKIYNK